MGGLSTAVVMAAAEGVVSARDAGLLREHGRYMQITRTWTKSLLSRMGYMKRKCSNTGIMTASHFEEVKEAFLADITAKLY